AVPQALPGVPAAADHGEQRQARHARGGRDRLPDRAHLLGRAGDQRAAFLPPAHPPGDPPHPLRLHRRRTGPEPAGAAPRHAPRQRVRADRGPRLRQDTRGGQGRGHARRPRPPSRVPGQPPLEHDPRRAAHPGDPRQARRALRAQRVHPGRDLGRRLVRSVGGRAGQGARPAHHPGAREPDRAHPRPRQLHQPPHPALSEDEVTDMNAEQLQRMKTHRGFIAALDQSGGSTPGALRAYGVKDTAWSTEEEMFAVVHQMRTRIITSPSFTGERILGAILFENTMDRAIAGQPTADYLWNTKRIVPFLKVDKGLAAEASGVQLMKPMPGLDALLARAKAKRIFGTKMRSVVKQANSAGIKDIVAQQFDVARQIIAADLVPIVEPEVDIHCPEKARAEELLKATILEALDGLPAGRLVMLKLTLPDKDDLYADLVAHPKVVRVVALSGGYSREEGNARLRRNHGVVASFSRALVEGLSAQQSDAEYNALLDASIQSIFEASIT